MAKEQDLSLTPATISGACGRLKCCLKFEHEGYQELEKNMPKRGNWCDTPQGRGRVCDRNLLTQKVSVQLETGNIVHFHRSEVTIRPPEQRPRISSERQTGRGNSGNGNGNRSRNNGGGGNQRNNRNENRPPKSETPPAPDAGKTEK